MSDVPQHTRRIERGSYSFSSFIFLLPGQVAAGGVVLAALGTLVLRLVHIEQAGGVLSQGFILISSVKVGP